MLKIIFKSILKTTLKIKKNNFQKYLKTYKNLNFCTMLKNKLKP